MLGLGRLLRAIMARRTRRPSADRVRPAYLHPLGDPGPTHVSAGPFRKWADVPWADHGPAIPLEPRPVWRWAGVPKEGSEETPTGGSKGASKGGSKESSKAGSKETPERGSKAGSKRGNPTRNHQHPPKGDWQALVGREIDSVVFALHDKPPYTQLHLLFTDGTTFEIYAQSARGFAGSRRLRKRTLPGVLSYIHPGIEARVFAAHPPPTGWWPGEGPAGGGSGEK